MSDAGIPVNAVAGGATPAILQSDKKGISYNYSCYTVVHAIQLCVLYNCACYTIVRAIQLFMLYKTECYQLHPNTVAHKGG